MIPFIVVFLALYFLIQLLQLAWPVVGLLVLLGVVYLSVSRLWRRPASRRRVREIQATHDRASGDLGQLRRETETAMWEEFRRHQ